MEPKELALIAAKALDDKQGKGIAAIKVTDLTTLADHFVIATGGSVVCRERSVKHLKSSGVLVWIDAPLGDLERRIGGMKGIRARGVAIGRGMTLKDLFEQRLPLYEKAADIRVECGGLDAERCCAKIIQELERYGTGR